MKLRPKPSDEDRLARLADGSIAEAERAELERAVAASPELAAKLAEQRRALQIVAAVDVEAPVRLLGRISGPEPAARRARRRLPIRGVVVVAGVALILALIAIRGTAADVRGEVHIALDRATLSAPARSRTDPAALTVSVAGISFPYWSGRGWRATGARTDSFGDRAVETVFYNSADYGRVGYSIVAGAPLAVGRTQQVLRGGGVVYSILSADGATVVTWQREGHTCVLASRRAPASALLALAGWV